MSVLSSPQSRSRTLAHAVLAFSFCLIASGAPAAGNAQGLPDFTELVEKVGPAVVNIRTIERAHQARSGSGDPDEDMAELLRRFFGQPPGQQLPNRPSPHSPQPDEPQQRGFASGFILNADGYVLTNAHVLDGADEVMVTLADKREFKAKTIGADRRSDVALLKIDATGLPTVRIGDVSKLKVGEWVIAIGSPFGLESTVTAGIVSAKSRDTGELLPLIQTDVAINPGNSGGPLINMRGEVVGINSQIYSRSGGYMGISFAIPIDEATRVSEQLRAGGRVIRGRIGVVIDPVTREVAEAIGLGKATGALVRSVEAGGPADKAGVEPGDIITRVDSRAVESSVELPRIVGNIKPGTQIGAAGLPSRQHARAERRRRRVRAGACRRAGHAREGVEAGTRDEHRTGCVGPERRPEAGGEDQERRPGRRCRGRRGARRGPRKRHHPEPRQRRGHWREAVRGAARQGRQGEAGDAPDPSRQYGALCRRAAEPLKGGVCACKLRRLWRYTDSSID